MDQLTNTERLLLAQAVYQEGASDWSKVSQIVSNHPLIGRPKSYFNPSVCSSMYTGMIHAAELEDMAKDNAEPRAEVNRKLAEVHYAARVKELRDLIFQEETRFKTVLTEIEEIRSGLWDERIKISLGIVSPEVSPEQPPEVSPEVSPEVPQEVSQEASQEASPEVSQEVSQEASQEASPEVSQEASPEVSQEASPEVSQEAPPEVSQEASPKVPQEASPEVPREASPEVSREASPEVSQEASPEVSQEFSQDIFQEVSQEVSPEILPEPSRDAPAAQEVAEVEEFEEPTNETEDVSMVDAEPLGQQDDPIIIDDSDATTDEPLLAQHVTQELEEEEVDLHLTPDSFPPSPKPTEVVDTAQEQVEITNEEPVEPVQEEAEPHSPFTEQEPEEREAEGNDGADVAELGRTPSPPAPPEETPADREPEQEDAQEVVASEKDEPDTGVQTRRGKRKAEAEADPRREKKKSREISEPLEESEPEPAPAKKRRGTTSEAASRIFQNVIYLLHDQICQLRNGSIFHGPVKVSDAPDYYDLVRRPIDLKAIKTKIRDGQIANSLEYQRDIFLMFANSMMYNRPDSDLYKMAEEMMLESEQLINQFRQTEGWNQ